MESCFKDLRSKSIILVKKGLSRKMRTKWGPILEPLRTPSCYFDQNAKRSLSSAYLQHYTFCDKSSYVHHGTTVTYPISLEIHEQQDAGGYFFIYSRGTHFQGPRYIIFREDEAFCVKWGLNEDHFGSLVLMRTKSSIEDLFERTGYVVGVRLSYSVSFVMVFQCLPKFWW